MVSCLSNSFAFLNARMEIDGVCSTFECHQIQSISEQAWGKGSRGPSEVGPPGSLLLALPCFCISELIPEWEESGTQHYTYANKSCINQQKLH